jgi:hypothetical protein
VLTPVGTTEHFDISAYLEPGSDPTSYPRLQNLKNSAESKLQQLASWFPGVAVPPKFTVTVLGYQSCGGAFHMSCTDAAIYADSGDGNATSDDFVTFLVFAEAVEVLEAQQNKGWECGATNGEGLSRVLAEALCPDALPDGAPFATAASWLDSPRPDHVTSNEETDGDPVSNGCAVLFLNWLHDQLAFSWDEIVTAAGTSLGATFQSLTGLPANQAYAIFAAEVASK